MKVITQIFLVLAFILVVCSVVLQFGIDGHKKFYNHAADLEEAKIPADLHNLRKAEAKRDALIAEIASTQAKAEKFTAINASERTALKDSYDALLEVQGLVKKTYDAQTNVVNGLASDTVIASFKEASKKLAEKTSTLITERETLDGNVSAALLDVQKRRSNFAVSLEGYRAKELALYLLNEQLSSRSEELAKLRHRAPGLQRQVGDNGGKVEGARVVKVNGTTVKLNRGSENGVQLYQYFNVIRNGRVISTVRVTSLANRSALAIVEPGSGSNVRMQVNDRLSRRDFVNAGYTGRTNLGGR